mmetsp:Transcript_14377/g.29596  ORF Transcript_14377/g.29596 Transcript_14377/m.29596 type:complete len:180 (-) Transcript_14377:275-814(-)|eukprot:CAMPEP_0118649132 /NCGR_PEP_ID=MMETSP0785-20121206/9539_1 /TAXON_ID=91992 /ORGANISM="Bolidomonas pacifica, Strain CCMP 1866" /LENGTH=179 /DNA_ID=CAMNT_0006541397 /DNA_START=91 /DNA_END=630 /DNA_ORIENTATION=+
MSTGCGGNDAPSPRLEEVLIYCICLRVKVGNLLSAFKVFNQTIGTRTEAIIKGTAVIACEGGDKHQPTTVHLMLESKMEELLTVVELLETHNGVISCEINPACNREDPQQSYFFNGDFSMNHPFVENDERNTDGDEHKTVSSDEDDLNREIRRELIEFELWKHRQRDIPTPDQMQRNSG